jgi:hypothetical protein
MHKFWKETFLEMILIYLLFVSLPIHVERKLDDKGQSSWVWRFAKNLSPICVMMVFKKHTKGLDLLKFVTLWIHVF